MTPQDRAFHSSNLDCAVRMPERSNRSERGVLWVILLTALMMVVEIIVGYITHSMALLADGWHMATHVGALGITSISYVVARRYARHRAFTFGTGKVHAMGGFVSSLALGTVAVTVAVEAIARLVTPEAIDYTVSIPVAVLGLVVNLLSVWLLHDHGEHSGHNHDHGEHSGHNHDHGEHSGHNHDHGEHSGHNHDHGEPSGHNHDHGEPSGHNHDHGEPSGHNHDHGEPSGHNHRPGLVDHGYRAALLHVMADALTSAFAIVALSLGRWANQGWLDPATGLLGALVILKWGFTLGRTTAFELLDVAPTSKYEDDIHSFVTRTFDLSILDLHVWCIGRGKMSCIMTVETTVPCELAQLRRGILKRFCLAHLTIEVRTVAPLSH